MKRKAILIILPVLATLIAISPARAQNVVGYWRFEDGSLADDSSGNNRRLKHTKEWWGAHLVDFKTGHYALPPSQSSSEGAKFPKSFSGDVENSGAVKGGGRNGSFAGDYLVGPRGNLHLNDERGFSIEAFINTSSSSGNRTIVAQGGGAQDGSWDFSINSSNELQLSFATSEGPWSPNNTTNCKSESIVLAPGRDYYVAASLHFDGGKTFTITFFIQDLSNPNSKLQSIVQTGYASNLYDSKWGVTIGSSALGAFCGVIDEVRLSKGSMSESDLLINQKK